MGVDIESWAEVRVQSPHWFAVDKDLVEGRSYELYYALCDWGVEVPVMPLTTRRGLPPNVSIVVKKTAEDWGGYKHSWLTLREMQEAELPWEILGNHARGLFERALARLVEIADEHGADDTTTRMVFWFD
jgi:hypothetical protein